jgi:fermentation-respiration switch protein FrsA (DUF1100 family)
MQSVKIKNRDMYWDIAADIYFPPNFSEKNKYPAIISAHPIGSCKEQTSGNVYGVKLAEQGIVVIAFDAGSQGASGGEPRFIEDPTLRVEDFHHVADYPVTLPYVDEDRIGVLGIRGGGGYSINAAMTEHRIKAVGTVTGVNYRRLWREGFSGYVPLAALEAIAKQRTAEARGAALRVDDLLPPSPEEAKRRGLTEIDLYEATEYYRTPRETARRQQVALLPYERRRGMGRFPSGRGAAHATADGCRRRQGRGLRRVQGWQ